MALALATWAAAGCAVNEPDRSASDIGEAQAAATASAAATDAATLSRVQAVRPVLTCIEALAGNRFRAHFGYTNSGPSSVSIPIGPLNHFQPGPANRGQPTAFAPGTVADAVRADFPASGGVSWVLAARTASATRLSPRCGAGGTGGSGVGGTTGIGGMTGTGGAGTGGSPVCPSSCDDANPCTSDSCGAETGFACAHVAAADGTACDDGNACTSGDSCQGGQCAPGTPTTCAPSVDACRVAACDPASGACITVPGADGTACSTGQFCTVSETCTAGVCGGGSPRVCTPPPCFVASCVPDIDQNGGCAMFPEPGGTPCTTSDGRPGACGAFIPVCSPLP